jgi:hypothetical protein
VTTDALPALRAELSRLLAVAERDQEAMAALIVQVAEAVAGLGVLDLWCKDLSHRQASLRAAILITFDSLDRLEAKAAAVP